MDRSEALLIYLASAVTAINAALMASWAHVSIYGPGPWLGLYSLAYLPAAYMVRPRNRRAVFTIAWAITAAFLGYSAWLVYQAIAG